MNSTSHIITFTLARAERPPAPRTKRKPGRLPRITRLMALAIRFEELLRRGTVKDYAELARLGGVSRARISQIMNLRNLAPDLQERLLCLAPVRTNRDRVSERRCRAVMEEPNWARQREIFRELFGAGQQ